jgi:uncharacterized protein YacL (UPF0231 family)
MQAFREAKYAEGKKAIVEQIKADMAKIQTIESKYDSQEKQQVSSEVAAGQELGEYSSMKQALKRLKQVEFFKSLSKKKNKPGRMPIT